MKEEYQERLNELIAYASQQETRLQRLRGINGENAISPEDGKFRIFEGGKSDTQREKDEQLNTFDKLQSALNQMASIEEPWEEIDKDMLDDGLDGLRNDINVYVNKEIQRLKNRPGKHFESDEEDEGLVDDDDQTESN